MKYVDCIFFFMSINVNMNTWTVVKFQNENAVEAVPSGWLLGNDECFWPPWTKDKLISAIKNSEEPKSCWPSFKVNIFRDSTYESYWMARTKAKKAEETSDLNSDSDHTKRRFRKRKRISSSASDSDGKGLEMIESPPQMRNNSILVNTTPKEIQQDQRRETLVTSYFSKSQNESTTSVTPNEGRPSTPLNNFNKDISNDVQLNKETCTCCHVHNNGKYLKEILNQQHLLRSIMGDLLSEMKTKQLNNVPPVNTESIFTKFHLPLENEEAIEDFENFLKGNEEMFQNTVKEIAKLGGSSPYEFIKRAMSMLMSNELAIKYSWLGRREKKAFHITQLARLVKNAADEGGSSGSFRDTEVALKSWLKRAKERSTKQ